MRGAGVPDVQKVPGVGRALQKKKNNVSETEHVLTLYPIRQFNALIDSMISINFPERNGCF
jgi:hypothetical protein